MLPLPPCAQTRVDLALLDSRDYKVVLDVEKVAAKLEKAFNEATANRSKTTRPLPAPRFVHENPLSAEGQRTVSISCHLKVIHFHSLIEGVGCASTQGFRDAMEDTHLSTEFSYNNRKMRISGVFDGHGGKEAAEYGARSFVPFFLTRLKEFDHKTKDQDVAVWNALKHSFVDMHRSFEGAESGSTANICVRIGNVLWVANLGDARAFLLLGNEFMTLSEDAKPRDKFMASISKRGGRVIEKRIEGAIGPGRYFGNHDFGAINSPRPKIVKVF